MARYIYHEERTREIPFVQDLLEEMWVQIDLGQDRLVCAVNVYSRRGKYLHNFFLSQKQKYSWQRINEVKST